jgi:hypothetical protein
MTLNAQMYEQGTLTERERISTIELLELTSSEQLQLILQA